MPTFAHSYSVTRSSEDKRQALAAAEALSWAFNPNSQTLRTFESWMPKPATHWAAQIVIVGACVACRPDEAGVCWGRRGQLRTPCCQQ